MTLYQTKLPRGLPKKTTSLCPKCRKVIGADIFERDGAVWISKECPVHGHFEGIYWSDVDMYLRAEKYAYDGRGVQNPQIPAASSCPADCGLCNLHLSSTCLANIDVTNRCNLSCDFCFANANVRGYVYEPSLEQIKEMLSVLRDERPVSTKAVQFSGGEPTLREDLPAIIKMAKEMGFLQVQIATNGVRLGREPELAQAYRDAGLSTVYLHFDGISKKTEPLLEVRKKAIENCRKAKQGVVLVPTIINGVNDHEIGDTIRFAAENIDVIRGVNFQPIAFTGAAPAEDIKRQRFTIPDLADRIEKQTNGVIKKTDLYPVPCVVSLSKLVEAYRKEPQIEFSAHPHCGVATYAFVSDGNIIPINRFVDVDQFFSSVDETVGLLNSPSRLTRVRATLKGLKALNKCIHEDKQPKNVNLKSILKQVLKKQDYLSLSKFHWNALFIGSMHFQDAYNYDIERVKRCVIHYVTPDPERRIIPFCAYNSGPTFRNEIEQKYSIPLDEWEKQHGKVK